jgi:hypothetical protein
VEEHRQQLCTLVIPESSIEETPVPNWADQPALHELELLRRAHAVHYS